MGTGKLRRTTSEGWVSLIIPEYVRLRFWAKVVSVQNEFGCWEWTGSRQPAGYGQMTARKVFPFPEKAHRISYWMGHGPDSIPVGMVVRHKICNNPPCVRLSHLRVGTDADNVQDMMEAGRHVTWNRGKTQCTRGHVLPSTPNAVDGKGNPYRSCGECKHITYKERRARNADS